MKPETRSMLILGFLFLFIVSSVAVMLYFEPSHPDSMITDYEVRKEIMVPLNVAAFDAQNASNLLQVGERPTDEYLAMLEVELQDALTALKRWRELEKK